jgi:hypothetical protein
MLCLRPELCGVDLGEHGRLGSLKAVNVLLDIRPPSFLVTLLP